MAITESKPWYSSLTIDSLILTVISSGLAILMAVKPDSVQPEEAEAIKSNVGVIVAAAVALLTSLSGIIGRVRAKTTIQ